MSASATTNEEDHDNEPGGGWRDELDEALRTLLRVGPLSVMALRSALRAAMGDTSIDEVDVRAAAGRIHARIDLADVVSEPAPSAVAAS